MLPLAMIIKGQGHEVSGSDRSYDQGRTPEKFIWITSQSIILAPQDGSGLTSDMILVVSSAIEESIPDVKRARELNIPIIKRAELLSSLFNAAETRVGIAGTSGKSTTTGMMAYALSRLNKNPTMMNGAVVKDFQNKEDPYATYLNGAPELFVSEIDESDGSIELYHSTHAILTNIALDHKPMEELIPLFVNYAKRAGHIIVPYDAPYISEVTKHVDLKPIFTFGIKDSRATISADDIQYFPDRVVVWVGAGDDHADLTINCPGQHNVMNALAVITCLYSMNISLHDACKALTGFSGIKRRMEVVGKKNDILVYDDFAHNPDKISASLTSLKQHEGRLLVMFQMHGFGPLKLMRAELIDAFCNHLGADDHLYMPEVLYLGGTVDRSYTAHDFIGELQQKHTHSYWYETRDDAVKQIIADAKPYDRIVIMGARDDTLSDVAKFILDSL